MSWRKSSLGSPKPQRLASSNESVIVTPSPQLAQLKLAQLKSTSSARGHIIGHQALLMMKDEAPQLWQANSFASTSWRTHHAHYPETYITAVYMV